MLGAKNLDEQKKYDKVHIDEAKRHLFMLLEHGKKWLKASDMLQTLGIVRPAAVYI